jgi:ADP-heptose:LPS heptosyltransferase
MAIATTCATPLPRLWVGLAEAKLRVGPSTSGSDRLLNLVIQSAPARDGAAAGLSFLSFLGIDPKELTPGWDVTQADRDYARRLLNLRRRGNDGWLLGVDPARGRDGQRPAPDRLAWVVDRIVEHRGAAPILVTAEATNGCIEEFRRCLKSDSMVVPTRGLRDALALARVCRMFVGPDTDLFRFARALHVPSLGLFQTPTAADADARCEVVEWRSGDRVRETDVLNRVDRLLRRSVVELPLRLLLGGDGSAASECVQRA